MFLHLESCYLRFWAERRATGSFTVLIVLVCLTWKLWQDNKTIELLDPVVEVSWSSYFVPLRYTHVGLLCVQESPDERPTMLEVVAMLKNEQTALAAPQHPAFTARSTSFTAIQVQKVEIHSVNKMTFSLMEPRWGFTEAVVIFSNSRENFLDFVTSEQFVQCKEIWEL